jgi:hypothetical protein
MLEDALELIKRIVADDELALALLSRLEMDARTELVAEVLFE